LGSTLNFRHVADAHSGANEKFRVRGNDLPGVNRRKANAGACRFFVTIARMILPSEENVA
jgi:hypothetical protein